MKSLQTMRFVHAASPACNGARKSSRDNAAASDPQSVSVRLRGTRCLPEVIHLDECRSITNSACRETGCTA
jgi:hypothetical protein